MATQVFMVSRQKCTP